VVSGAKSCEHLGAEHELIGQVLSAIEMLTARTRGGGAIPAPAVAGAIDFFAGFVAGCHELKEELGLLPTLLEHGEPPQLALDSVRAEHDEGRRFIDALRPVSLRSRIDGEAIALVEAYAAFLRRHVAMESTRLFPWAASVLTPADERRVARAFAEVEKRAGGPGGRDVVLALADAVTQACQEVGSPAAWRKGALARDVMRAGPPTIGPGETMARAAEIMASLGIRELPVVDRGALVGILTRSDMEPRRGHFEWTTVSEAMTPDPVTVEGDTPVGAVARLLLTRSFNSVPVVEGRELVGVIARSDLLTLLAGEDPPPES
jgi:CBS domain-containing protein